MEPQEDHEPVFEGPAPSDAELYAASRTSTDLQGRTKPEVRIYGNRAGMQWLAYECLRLAYATDLAVESGFHIHIEDYKHPYADWPVNITLEIAKDEQIRKLRQEREQKP